MLPSVYEQVESNDLMTALEALAQITYEVSERFGGCYLTTCRCRGFNSVDATADLKNDNNYTGARFRPKDKP